MSERDVKQAEDLLEVDAGQEGPEQPSPSSDEVKRSRRQRAYEALLVAKGQLIVVPDDITH